MTEEFNTQRDEKTDSRHNLTWHMMDINRQKREKQMQQKAFTIWMSGLSGAGKSTIANVLEKQWEKKRCFWMEIMCGWA